jgi:hypothetical protein
LRLIYYALGGGHGHVVRGLAVLGRVGGGAMIGPARLAAWAQALHVEMLSPPAQSRAAVTRWLAKLPDPELIVVDTFPTGVASELGAFLARAPVWLVARRVRPSFYLEPRNRALIEKRCERLIWVEPPPEELRRLRVRQSTLPAVLLETDLWTRAHARAALMAPEAKPLIVAIGSGDPEGQRRMLRLLLKLGARLGAEVRFVSAELPADAHVRRMFPVTPCLPAADVVIAAGGYHAVHEIAACGSPAVFVPQKRRYDDQFARVSGLAVARNPVDLERLIRARITQPASARATAWPGGARLLAREIGARLRPASLD